MAIRASTCPEPRFVILPRRPARSFFPFGRLGTRTRRGRTRRGVSAPTLSRSRVASAKRESAHVRDRHTGRTGPSQIPRRAPIAVRLASHVPLRLVREGPAAVAPDPATVCQLPGTSRREPAKRTRPNRDEAAALFGRWGIKGIWDGSKREPLHTRTGPPCSRQSCRGIQRQDLAHAASDGSPRKSA